MFSFEEIAMMLDEIVDDLPEYVFKGLNGGVYLLPDIKHNPKIPSDQYYVLGEYVRQPVLGNMIYVYYGSLMATYPNDNQEEIMQKLKEIIHHEFQHHMEYRAGCRDLEIEDEKFVEQANEMLQKHKEE